MFRICSICVNDVWSRVCVCAVLREWRPASEDPEAEGQEFHRGPGAGLVRDAGTGPEALPRQKDTSQGHQIQCESLCVVRQILQWPVNVFRIGRMPVNFYYFIHPLLKRNLLKIKAQKGQSLIRMLTMDGF